MKKLFLILFIVVVATISMFAQSEGLWQRSDGASQLLLSEKSYGFELKFNDGILQAKYVSDAKDGSPVYSAMYGNNVMVLIKVADDETIYINSTQDATLRKWKFVGEGQVQQRNQNQNKNYQNNQNQGGNTCTFCKGTGEIRCSACSGKGSHKKTVYTPNYNLGGADEYVKDSHGDYVKVKKESSSSQIDEPCSFCSGTGQQTCRVCGGTGNR